MITQQVNVLTRRGSRYIEINELLLYLWKLEEEYPEQSTVYSDLRAAIEAVTR